MNTELLNHRSQSIHAGNVQAGWWTNIVTGESIVATRSRPEIMMLVVTELSEANEGVVNNLMDDKLPHRSMEEVEIADAAIRLHDIAGADQVTLTDQTVEETIQYFNRYDHGISQQREGVTFTEDLMAIVDLVSEAMEGYRKSNGLKYSNAIGKALIACYYVADQWDVDIEGAIREKLEFNKVREDHQISNRLKEDGKKI